MQHFMSHSLLATIKLVLPLANTLGFGLVWRHHFELLRPHLEDIDIGDCYQMDTSPQLAYILRAMADSDPNKLPMPASCTAGM
jgi:hypothetical protein